MPYVIFPASTEDPTGQDRRERGAINQFATRFEKIRKEVKTLLADIPVKKKTLSVNFGRYQLNAEELVRYEFEIDTLSLSQIGEEIDAIVDRWIEAKPNGEEGNQWFVEGYVTPAYQQGTGMAFANIAAQSVAYKSTRENLTELLKSDAYRTRLGFIHARSFEQMRNLSTGVKESMRTVLVDGMAQGLHPNEIAKQLDAATDMGITRARRIARTEITTAMRRARIEEAEQTVVDLGLNLRMMQLSALSATTRASHAARHGKLFTFEQARVWMSTSPNMINCKCTFVEVLVDADGKPLIPGVIARAAEVKKKSGY